MKKAIYFLLAALFLFLNCLPSTIVFADDSGYTDSQLADVGTLMLSSLISSGEATELDFSDYTENDGLDFLIALGELAVTGDPSDLIDQGLTWLGGELDDAYQSLIEDIRAWEHDVAPDLYNWWYNSTQYEYKLVPNSNISRPLTNLLRHPEENPIIPTPDTNYSSYLNNINSKYDQGSYHNFFWKDTYITNSNTSWNIPSWYGNDYTYIYSEVGVNYYRRNFMDRQYSTSFFVRCNPVTVNIISIGENRYSYTISPVVNQIGTQGSTPIKLFQLNGYNNQGNCDIYTWYNGSGIYTPCLSYSGSLQECLSELQYFVRNVNINVDGVPWSIVFDNSPTYPIVIPGALTVLNNQPVQYSFPTPTYYDVNGLKTLITNAINNSDVITWQDIDDYFLDINGQQALPVVEIYRNDYDNMYVEQYPYPAKLIGMQDPLKFNEHMLDNYYGQYLTPMVDVVANTVDVIPGEIKWVLGIGAILMIFAVIINRLLE